MVGAHSRTKLLGSLAIKRAEPSARGRITYERAVLDFPKGLDDGRLRATLGAVPGTGLSDGVAGTIAFFKHAIASGRLPAHSEEE